MNSSSITDWIYNQNNQMTVNIVQQAVSLFFGVLIFIRTYDFQSLLKSVRDSREKARKEKERKKLLKFKKLMELAKSGGDVDISKVNLSEENESEEEEKVPDHIMKMARKKSKRADMSV